MTHVNALYPLSKAVLPMHAIVLYRAVATGSWISFDKDMPGEAVHVG